MSAARLSILTTLAMIAFAGNTVFCRAALQLPLIDAASFTSIRLLSGAVTLWLLVSLGQRTKRSPDEVRGNWFSALALFAYAATFSFAYLGLETGTGALLLFGAVQATMIGWGIFNGERLTIMQVAGLIMALAGIIVLMMPGVTAPPVLSALLMLTAGVAWGIYSIRGKGPGSPLVKTAGNFIRTIPMTLVLSILVLNQASADWMGVVYAMGSGALASGVGYAIWYQVLPQLRSTSASVIQLSVPVIASAAGALLLAEPLTIRLVLASITILGGIGLVIYQPKAISPQT